jgi:YgiT-type zinc finger domain-containing protein
VKPEQCSFCKGGLYKGKTEFMVKVGNEIVSIKEVPAYICENCHEAYYTPDISRKIDSVMQDFHQGRFLAHPIAAGELEFESYDEPWNDEG